MKGDFQSKWWTQKVQKRFVLQIQIEELKKEKTEKDRLYHKMSQTTGGYMSTKLNEINPNGLQMVKTTWLYWIKPQ